LKELRDKLAEAHSELSVISKKNRSLEYRGFWVLEKPAEISVICSTAFRMFWEHG